MPTGAGALAIAAGPATPAGRRRGGGGAPATDPRTVTDFEEIHPFCVPKTSSVS